ncbi:MAG TPA: selenocysteine-specific translation elongation factor [Pyrinomonadaceae bacterium]|nr:selenocysteine-specific translation elongation factor [Pyrinomonadaceae bacterium]
MEHSIIVGTAGHIDHGKTALVRALTGKDPDRLPEEKKRGITIDLGFADLLLGELRLGFVDVPGHERFVKNMLAGAHGIDLVTLVIAADEGVMPQTREHFDICRLLGVKHGIVVLTKCDLVDDEMLELVKDEARELVAGSFLEGAPMVGVSSKNGEGLDHLNTAIKEVAQQISPRSADFITRLPIDRAFTIKGFGPVVTGTLISGEIKEGDELELHPAGTKVRIRGTQVHGRAVQRARPGQRTAVNLAGVDTAMLERGMVIAASGQLRPTQILDARIDVLKDAPRALKSRARVRMHIGAAEVLGRVKILDDDATEISPGNAGLAQLRLESPVVALHGDRFIIRSYSPSHTIAGGVVLDPMATKHRAKDNQATFERLRQLESGEPTQTLVAFVSAANERGARLSELTAMTGWTAAVVSREVANATRNQLLIEANGVVLTTTNFERLKLASLQELRLFHKRESLARGMLRETLRERVFARSQPEVFVAVIASLENERAIIVEREIIRTSDHSVALSDEDLGLQQKLEDLYLRAGVEGPTVEEALTKAGIEQNQQQQAKKLLQLLLNSGRIVRVANDMYMHQQTISELIKRLLTFAASHEPERLIDVPTFKDLAGVSRKYAIPLLEYFDRERVTRRAGDKRLILKP